MINADLWTRLLDLCAGHEIQFVWVKGHARNRENERCDQLALAAAARGYDVDAGYEQPVMTVSDAPSLFE